MMADPLIPLDDELHLPVDAPGDVPDNRRALMAAQLLQTLIRSRRCYLDEFLDGDGPYWITVGLFINDENERTATLDEIINFADESLETSLYLVRQLIARGYVQEYLTDEGVPAYRLSPDFGVTFGRYLNQQFAQIKDAWAQIG